MTRREGLRALLVLLAAALPLAACGRKGPPEPPEGADPKVPRRYPTRGY
jgi:predicted small lipoprotein YifL